ncbi:hypothetical protein [Microbacterium lacus]|uniref:hypothetical protein n=1 Tax=Microbacterium lacus TaxID=415217 RepID=UPI0031D1A687
MKTIDGQPMTSSAISQPLGASLRIAPGFLATSSGDETGVETTLEARYNSERGRYIVVTVLNRAVRDDFDDYRLLHTAPQAIVRAAVPHCITVRLEDTTDSPWISVADLTTSEGRIIPPWMADAVTRRGVKDARWDVIEILYGTSALSDTPPAKLIALELGIPERTASYWIGQARSAGRLEGMQSNVGRPADD